MRVHVLLIEDHTILHECSGFSEFIKQVGEKR